MKPSLRIFYNTIALYVKLIIVMLISFINVRLILSALGEVDYGIYTLIAGSINMLAILRVAMTSASMRYMSFSLGTSAFLLIKQTFNTIFLLHLFIGLIIFFLIEFSGVFMFKYWFNIPFEKIADARLLYHFVALTTLVMVITVPFDAIIYSHENIFFLSITEILSSILRLFVGIYLVYRNTNQLLVYGGAILIIQIVLTFIKGKYSFYKYPKYKINLKKYFSRKLSFEILSFSGWNLLGSIAAMSVTQMRNILLNMFFGVRLNTANGLSMQVSNQLNQVSVNLTRALNPQLVKQEGGGERRSVIKLTEKATKYSAFIFAFFSIPVIVEMPLLFSLWLKNVPDYAIIFTRLLLINLMIEKFSFEITNLIRAVGEIKLFQLIETFLFLLNVPITWIFYKNNYSPVITFVISILLAFIIFVERLIIGKKIAKINIKEFLINAVYPLLLPISISLIIIFILKQLLPCGILYSFFIVLLFMITISILFIKLSLDKEEVNKFRELLIHIFNKIKNYV